MSLGRRPTFVCGISMSLWRWGTPGRRKYWFEGEESNGQSLVESLRAQVCCRWQAFHPFTHADALLQQRDGGRMQFFYSITPVAHSIHNFYLPSRRNSFGVTNFISIRKSCDGWLVTELQRLRCFVAPKLGLFTSTKPKKSFLISSVLRSIIM